MAKTAKWTAITIAVIVLIGGIIFGLTVLGRACAVAGKVTDPDRILYTYEWFFNKYASIENYTQQIKVADEAVETFKADHADNLNSYANSVELSRLRSVAQALRNQQISAVNEYNAAARNKTRTIFRDWSLPSCLTITEDGRVVECY